MEKHTSVFPHTGATGVICKQLFFIINDLFNLIGTKTISTIGVEGDTTGLHKISHSCLLSTVSSERVNPPGVLGDGPAVTLKHLRSSEGLKVSGAHRSRMHIISGHVAPAAVHSGADRGGVEAKA